MCVMPTSPRRQFRLVPSRPFPASSRPVRGKFSCNDDLCRTPWKRVKVVLRGLDPRIHAFVSTAPRRGCPRIEVRGLKAHGSSPAKTKLAGEFLPLVAARFFPGQPCALRERVLSGARRVRALLVSGVSFTLLAWAQKSAFKEAARSKRIRAAHRGPRLPFTFHASDPRQDNPARQNWQRGDRTYLALSPGPLHRGRRIVWRRGLWLR